MSALCGYDPPVDRSVKVFCVQAACPNADQWWHPEVEEDFTHEGASGEMAWFHVDGSHDCPECGVEGMAV